MRIAVGSQNYRTVTPHGGRTRRFLVYEVPAEGEPAEVERLDLPKELAFHEFHGDGPHPLDTVDVLIVGSAGPGFIRRLGARGITAVTTSEEDPATAVKAWRDGTLPPAPPHRDEGHAHDHAGHGHGHEHGHGGGHHHGPGAGSSR